MLSNACRPNATKKGMLWKLALNSVPQISDLNRSSSQSGIDTIMNFSVWFEALVQQYGPGSPYLDVSSSIEVALWFALNEVEITNREFWISPTGHPKIPIYFPTMHFNPKFVGTAWFYVMDVPIWDGSNIPQHGELVDLLEGPELVSSSIRIKRQKGSLVFADRELNGGDLSSFYVCDPIEISSLFSGSELVNESFTYLFPEPEDDPWFQLLSKAPLVPHLDELSGFSYKQSLEVYVVTNSKEIDKDFLPLQRQIEEIAMPTRAVVRTYPEILKKIRATSSMDIEEATYILVEVPLLSTTPPINLWNQTVLRYGLGKNARPKLSDDYRILPYTSLENVLFEFSALDTSFYRNNLDDEPITAMWITIENETYQCTYFFKEEGGFSFKPFAIEYTFSLESGQFEIKGERNIPVVEINIIQGAIKYFFIALHVLRKFSPTLKPDSFTIMNVDNIAPIPIRGETVTLVRSKNDPMDMRLHFLVDSKSGEAYLGPTFEHDASTILSVRSADKFPSMKSLQEIYGYTDKISYPQLDLPKRQTDGFDSRIADFVSDIISQLQQN